MAPFIPSSTKKIKKYQSWTPTDKLSGSVHVHAQPRETYFNMVFFDFSLTVKAAPHECVIRTGQP